jgi:uncharacterized protein with HEPN domain
MARHRQEANLMQMRDVSLSVLAAVGNKPPAQFPLGDLRTDGLLHRLTEISRAASRVRHEMKINHPTVAWAEIDRWREQLLTEYDRIDMDNVWRIIHEELPPLLAVLRAIVGDEPPKT